MCSPKCLKVSLLVFLSISLVFCQLQILCFMLLSYWLSLFLAILLSSTLFTLAFYGALAGSHVALYLYVGLQLAAWLVESILLMTIGIHIIGWEANKKFVLQEHNLSTFHKNSSRMVLEMKPGDQKVYSGVDVLENYLRYFSHVPIFCREFVKDDVKSRMLYIKNHRFQSVQYQRSAQCKVTLLAWFTVLRDIYDLNSLILATIYACFLQKTRRPASRRKSRERVKTSTNVAVGNDEGDKQIA